MSKVETNIKRVVGPCIIVAYAAMLSLSMASRAASNDPPQDSGKGGCLNAALAVYKDNGGPHFHDQTWYDNQVKECNSTSNSGDQCQTASNDFHKALNDFRNSCSAAGFNSSSSEGFGCLDDVLKCTHCSNTDDDSGGVSCSDFDDSDSDSSSSGSAKYGQLCGMKQNSGLSLDEWNKELKDDQNKIDDLNQKVVDLTSDNMDKAQSIQQQITDAQKSYRDSVQQTQKQFKQQQEDLEKHLDDMSAQVKQSGDHITKIRQDMRNAKVSLDIEIRKLDLKCHSDALAQIKELQKQRQAMIQAGTYNVGSLNNLFRNHVGKKSQLQLDQQAAQTLYLQCQQDQEYLKGVQTAQETYNAAIQSMNETITSLMQDQSTTLSQRERDRIEKAQKILTDNQQEINNATQDYTATMKNLQQQKQQAAQQMQQKQMLYQQQLANAKKDLDDLKSKGPKNKDKIDAFAKFGGAQTAAEGLLAACQQTSPPPRNGDTALRFLRESKDTESAATTYTTFTDWQRASNQTETQPANTPSNTTPPTTTPPTTPPASHPDDDGIRG